MISYQDVTRADEERARAREAHEEADDALRDARYDGTAEDEAAFDAIYDRYDKAYRRYSLADRVYGYMCIAYVNQAAAVVARALYDGRERLAGKPAWYKRTEAAFESVVTPATPEGVRVTLGRDCVYVRLVSHAGCERSLNLLTSHLEGTTWEPYKNYFPASDDWAIPGHYDGPQTADEVRKLAAGYDDVKKRIAEARDAYRDELRALVCDYSLLDYGIGRILRDEGNVTY